MSVVTVKVHTLVAFAAGLAIALIGVFAFHSWRVDAAPGDADTTFVPFTPCRLIDTRPAPNRIGPHGSFGIADTKTITAHGTNGNCTIPADAVGLSTNVTAVGATADTFLTFWGSEAQPTAANLNPRAGGPVAPNAVNTPLAGAGTFKVFNKAGTVDVIVDVNGYYTKVSLQALAADIDELRDAQPFAVTAEAIDTLALTTTPTAYLTITVTAPVAGTVTLNSTALVAHNTDGGDVLCSIAESTNIPNLNTLTLAGSQHFERAAAAGNDNFVAGTKQFSIAAGASVDYVLACIGIPGGGLIIGRNLTAVFTPAP